MYSLLTSTPARVAPCAPPTWSCRGGRSWRRCIYSPGLGGRSGLPASTLPHPHPPLHPPPVTPSRQDCPRAFPPERTSGVYSLQLLPSGCPRRPQGFPPRVCSFCKSMSCTVSRTRRRQALDRGDGGCRWRRSPGPGGSASAASSSPLSPLERLGRRPAAWSGVL